MDEGEGQLLRSVLRGQDAGVIALCGLVFAFAAGTHARNRVWQDMGNLWVDIADKVARMPILDPATGEESPRFERARVYNNIGLYLYNQARDLSADRIELLRLAAAYEQLPRQHLTPAQIRHLSGIKRDLLETDARIKEQQRAIIEHIPGEFREACRSRGVEAGADDWDPFIPAELCLKRALFHCASYSKAHLNLGLVWKLRSFANRPGGSQRQLLLLAAEHLRTAVVLVPNYALALRYVADVSILLERWFEARQAAARAFSSHREADGDQALIDTVVYAVTASIRLKEWRAALEWIRVGLALDPPEYERGYFEEMKLEAENALQAVGGALMNSSSAPFCNWRRSAARVVSCRMRFGRSGPAAPVRART